MAKKRFKNKTPVLYKITDVVGSNVSKDKMTKEESADLGEASREFPVTQTK